MSLPTGGREALAALEHELGVPSGSLAHRTVPEAEAPVESYLAKLARNPTWQALQTQMIDEAALLTWKLVSMNPEPGETPHAFGMRVELLRGEIRGIMRVLDGPAVAHRAIEQRRER